MARDPAHPNKRTNVRILKWLRGIALRSTRTGLGALSRVNPELAARLALRLFLRPGRHPVPARERAWAAQADSRRIAGVPTLAWGEGPVVLLVHGWEGRGSQLGALGVALAQVGFRAVALDLPAHGDADGSEVDLVIAAATIARVAEALEQVVAVVAHSFGAASTALAFQGQLDGPRLVFIAPPEPARVLGRFGRWLGFAPSVVERLERRLGERTGVDPRSLTGEGLAGTLPAPGLVIHDPEDAMVPFAEGAAYVAAWPGATLVEAVGLGHHRVLRAEEPVARVVSFIQAERRQRWSA